MVAAAVRVLDDAVDLKSGLSNVGSDVSDCRHV